MRQGSATPTLRRAGCWAGGLGRRAGPSRDAGLGLLYSALTGRPVNQVQVVNRPSLAWLQTKRSQAHFVTGSGRKDAGGDQQVSAAQVLQASCRGRHSPVRRRELRALSPATRFPLSRAFSTCCSFVVLTEPIEEPHEAEKGHGRQVPAGTPGVSELPGGGAVAPS